MFAILLRLFYTCSTFSIVMCIRGKGPAVKRWQHWDLPSALLFLGSRSLHFNFIVKIINNCTMQRTFLKLSYRCFFAIGFFRQI